MAAVRARVLQSIAEVDERAWDALLDASATPFVRWAWLEAMERSGCAAPRAGWTPSHLTLWKGETLIAAAPAYLKEDSEGDFSRDWGWASGAMNAGIAYYPKLIVTVPYTPVTGRRLLIAPGEDRPALAKRLVDAARALAKEQGLATVQVLFPDAEDLALLEAAEMSPRIDFQYHWFNAGYAAPDDFLARFTSKHRNMLKRERRAPTEQGITVRTVRGDELAQDPARFAKLAYTFHRTTVDKLMWGRRWLNEKFYQHVFAAIPENMELVVAEREGQAIAGAFNVTDGERLFGRYWGCLEEHPFLHFNVCLYHSIDDVIARGLRVMEGGAGGEHKIPRGFEPTETFSSHVFLDKRLDEPLRAHILGEAQERERALTEYRARSPIYKR